MTLGLEIVRWLLRRHAATHGRLDADLVLVRRHAALDDAAGDVEIGDETWRVRPVGGELTLRHALMDAPRLVALIPHGFNPPLDLAQRAWLRRPVMIDARDVVAAATGRFCMPIEDAALADRIVAEPAAFAEHARRWTFRDPVVQEAQARQIALGFGRPIERQRPEDLLAEWIAHGPPADAGAGLHDALRAAYPSVGEWLGAATRPDGLEAVVRAGALAAVPRLRPSVPGVRLAPQEASWEHLRDVVEPAVRRAWRTDEAAVRRLLAAAEAAARDARLTASEATRLPLLRAGFEAGVGALADALAAGRPCPTDVLEALHRNLQRDPAALDLLERLVRLARFERAELPEPAGPSDWGRLAREHVAWSDRLAREVRRGMAAASDALSEAADAVLRRYLARRDRQNEAFARTLARVEERAYRRGDLDEALPLHLLARTLIHPLTSGDGRVLLVVLDGCDLSTFLEVLDALPPDIGLTTPPASGRLLTRLLETGPWFTGLSPVPTLTAIGRRAIFAGDIPANAALDAEEASAANAAGDRTAFERNPALADVPRRLFLKGELSDDAEEVVQALRDRAHRLVAVVFNAIDDALSSKETTALGPWTAANLGRGFVRTLRTAMENGWRIVVTSDHGHTPFWATDRKVGTARGGGQRFAREPLDEGVRFPPVAWRPEPLHVLTRVGAYLGQQRRGCHGGAGIEEVLVPIALLGEVPTGDGRPAPPWWWTDDEPPEVPAPRAAPEPASAVERSDASWLERVPEGVRPLIAYLDAHDILTEPDAARIANPRAFRRLGRTLDQLIRDGVVPWRYRRESADGVARILRVETE